MRKYSTIATVCLVALVCLTVFCSAVSAISLEEIIELAEKHDAQLRADTFEAEARNADGWKLIAGYGPTLTVSGSYMSSRDSSRPDETSELENRVAHYNEGDLLVGMKQPVIDLEKASLAMRGMVERDISKFQSRKGHEELLLRVYERYYDVLSTRENLRLAMAESAALQKQLDSAKQKLDMGFGTITDKHNAEARYSLALAGEISGKIAADNSKKALEETIAQELEHEVEDLAPGFVLPVIRGDIVYWLEVATSGNTGLNLKKLQAKTAHLEYRAVQSRFLPSLVFFSDYNERHPDDNLLGYGEKRSEMDVGLRLEMNLLAGGQDTAAAVAASKREKAARERETVAKRSVNRSVRSLWESINNTRLLAGAYQQAVVANQYAMESTQASYDEGVKVLLDVLNAQQDYFRSLRQYKTTRYDYMVLLEKFRLVTGDRSFETQKHNIN